MAKVEKFQITANNSNNNNSENNSNLMYVMCPLIEFVTL